MTSNPLDYLNEDVLLIFDVEKTLTVGSEHHVDRALNPAFREAFGFIEEIRDGDGPFLVRPDGVWFIDDDPETTRPLDGSLVTDILYKAAERCGIYSREADQRIREVLRGAGKIWLEILSNPNHGVSAVEGVSEFLKYTQQFPNVRYAIVTGSPGAIAEGNLDVSALSESFGSCVMASGDQGLIPGINNRSDLIAKAIQETELRAGKKLKPVYFDDSIRAVTAAIEIPCPTVGVAVAHPNPQEAANVLAGGQNPKTDFPRADLVIGSYSPPGALFEKVMQLAARGPVPLAGIQTEFFGLDGIDRPGAAR